MANSNRLWIIGGGLVIVLVLLGGWFLGVQPQLAAAGKANLDREAVEDRNVIAELELVRLKKQYEELPELAEELGKLQRSVPVRSELESLAAQLQGASAASGAMVLSIDFGSAVNVAPATRFAELTPASVIPESFVTIPVTISATGPRDALLAFLDRLQSIERLTIVGSVTMAQGTDPEIWALDAQGATFVLIGEPAPTPTPTPTPSGTPTPAPSGTPAPSPSGTPD